MRRSRYSKERYLANAEVLRERCKAYQHKLRKRALQKMGGCCVQCGCLDQRILEIHHIYCDGKADPFRRNRPGFHRAIRDNTIDVSRLELLCPNCHTLKTKGYL